jgi:hypothetical protein
MIEQIKNLPGNMVGFRAMAMVTKEDFEHIVMPEVEKIVSKTGELNFMLVLDTNVKDFTAGAWMQDALLGLKNLTKWHRAAIVTDDIAIHQFTTVFSALVPGEFKGFKKIDMDLAVAWVSEKPGKTESK